MTIYRTGRLSQIGWCIGVVWLMAPPVIQAQEEPGGRRGTGLSVEPGGLLIQHVIPGETYDLGERSGVFLKVSNQLLQCLAELKYYLKQMLQLNCLKLENNLG